MPDAIDPARLKKPDGALQREVRRRRPHGDVRTPVFSSLPPLSVYLHVPWCVRKCPYCDFNSHALDGELNEAHYVDAVLADLDAELPRVWGRSVESIFIGGGTPSLFSAQAIDRLLSGLHARLRVTPAAEITLEANPGAADAGRFRDFVAAGVTRISVGVQSFHDELLARIGRVHDGAAARAAVQAALSSGASKVNADLMFALPGQHREQVCADVAQILSMGVEHVSFYQLTLEPNTAFHHRPPVLPSSDSAASMQNAGMALLAAHGLDRYEVSAFAARGARCQHNLNYWQFGDYLGIGAGAHGKLTCAAQGRVVRSVKERHPARYQQRAFGGDADSRRTPVVAQELPFECLLNGLRLLEGVSVECFERGTGFSVNVIGAQLERCREDGLLEPEHARIVATPLGMRFLDDLVARFLPG